MKKFFMMLMGIASILTACQDNDIPMGQVLKSAEQHESVQAGMQRIVVSSSDEIKQLINLVGDGKRFKSRSLPTAQLSNNEETFVSLVEANRQKVMATLTPVQKDSILNDEDGLEFCPIDSVIADIRFAQLLNADREIQVGTTVYKYVPNGVASTDVSHISELEDIESKVAPIPVTPENEGYPIIVAPNVEFRPIQYKADEYIDHVTDIDGNTGSTGNAGGLSNSDNTTATSTSNGIHLSNGFTITKDKIRDINYYDNGDGSWFHRTWSGLWGRNIVATNYFESNKRLRMNFYDQNYIIYANIGTQLDMQKKVCGMWWNTNAQEIVQGWETVSIKYTMPEPIKPKFVNPYNNKNEYPTHMWNPFPYGKDNILLLTIPFINYDFTTSDLNKAFNSGLNFAWNKAIGVVKELIKNDKSKAGLITFNNNDIYVIYGPYSHGHTNTSSVESKFYAKWFPGSYNVGFSYGSSVTLTDVKFSGNDGVELYRGRVFGAIKYNGKWLAARITKDRDRK